jgi:hypothetical protein
MILLRTKIWKGNTFLSKKEERCMENAKGLPIDRK